MLSYISLKVYTDFGTLPIFLYALTCVVVKIFFNGLYKNVFCPKLSSIVHLPLHNIPELFHRFINVVLYA